MAGDKAERMWKFWLWKILVTLSCRTDNRRGRTWCIKKSKCSVFLQYFLSVRRKGRGDSEERLCLFSYHPGVSITCQTMLGPLQTLSHFIFVVSLWGRTIKPFYWWGHWSLEEVQKIVRFGAPDCLIPKPLTTTLYDFSFGRNKCGEKRSCCDHVAWTGVSQGRDSLAEFSSGHNWNQKKPEGTVTLKSICFCYLFWWSFQKVFWIWSICFLIKFILSNC